MTDRNSRTETKECLGASCARIISSGRLKIYLYDLSRSTNTFFKSAYIYSNHSMFQIYRDDFHRKFLRDLILI